MNENMNQDTNTNMDMNQNPNMSMNQNPDMNQNMDINQNTNIGMNQNNPVVKKKSNKGLIVLIILLLIIIILLSSYIVYDKLNDKESAKKNESEVKENVSKEENKEEQEEKIESRDLTQEELTYFKDHFNKININGFVGQSYSNINDINLFDLLYVGIDEEYGKQLSEEEKQEYLKYSSADEIYTEVTKIEDDALKKFLKENANLDHKKGSYVDGFIYIPKYDAYYYMHGDTNYWGVDSCNSGKIDENGNYIVNCTLMDYSKESAGTNIKTTLKKVDDNFVFISNECESGDCETLKFRNTEGRK